MFPITRIVEGTTTQLQLKAPRLFQMVEVVLPQEQQLAQPSGKLRYPQLEYLCYQ
jgi:hypothetical protein